MPRALCNKNICNFPFCSRKSVDLLGLYSTQCGAPYFIYSIQYILRITAVKILTFEAKQKQLQWPTLLYLEQLQPSTLLYLLYPPSQSFWQFCVDPPYSVWSNWMIPSYSTWNSCSGPPFHTTRRPTLLYLEQLKWPRPIYLKQQ
jgi:hypothetical protein